MVRALVPLLACLLAAFAAAQEARFATVELDDGTVVAGRVRAMELTTLQVEVGGEIVTIPAARLRSCRFGSGAEGDPARAPAAPGEVAPDPGAASQDAGGEPAASAPTRAVRLGPLPDPVDHDALPPHDLRHVSRLRSRLEALDERYPWLVPTVPAQWVSLGLLLAIGLCLSVYLSARVSGAEAATLGRAMAVSIWYLLTGLLQVALVPPGDLSTVVLLLANVSMALFWLRGLFDLTRGGAVLALAVQLGFVALGFAVLELIDALLGSVVAASA